VLSPEKAEDIVERMAVLKFFPTARRAVSQLIESISEMCSDDDEAEALLTEMLRLDEWPGPATLRTVHEQMNSSKKASWQGFGQKPKVSCQKCGDWGHVAYLPNRRIRCRCESGQLLPDNVLEFINCNPDVWKLIANPPEDLQ
jgi:hypothetical protein